MPSNGPIVSGDIDALSIAAAACRYLDDSLLISSGSLTEVIAVFNASQTLTVIPDFGHEVGALARKWQVLTDALSSQAVAFATADGQLTSAPTHDCPEVRLDLNAVHPDLVVENRHLAMFVEHFLSFDTALSGDSSTADGTVSIDDLTAIAERSDELGTVARWILGQPDLVKFLDTGVENIDYMDKVEDGRFHAVGGDNKISSADVLAYVEKREVNRILREVAAEIDTAADGGSVDGVLSRSDYEAFVRAGQATDLQTIAIAIALEQGAVDGEQGIASDIADIAADMSAATGIASGGLAFLALAAGATVVLAPLAAPLGTAAAVTGAASTVFAGVEMAAGVAAGEDDHVISGGLGLVSAAVAGGVAATIRGATTPATKTISGSADEILAGMLEGTPTSQAVATMTEAAIGRAGDGISEIVVDNAGIEEAGERHQLVGCRTP